MGKQFKDLLGWVFNGADVRNRTADLLITKSVVRPIKTVVYLLMYAKRTHFTPAFL